MFPKLMLLSMRERQKVMKRGNSLGADCVEVREMLTPINLGLYKQSVNHTRQRTAALTIEILILQHYKQLFISCENISLHKRNPGNIT